MNTFTNNSADNTNPNNRPANIPQDTKTNGVSPNIPVSPSLRRPYEGRNASITRSSQIEQTKTTSGTTGQNSRSRYMGNNPLPRRAPRTASTGGMSNGVPLSSHAGAVAHTHSHDQPKETLAPMAINPFTRRQAPVRRSSGGRTGSARGGAPRGGFTRSTSPSRSDAGKTADVIPPIGDAIRIIPLGGVEEVGKNMTAIEIGDDIIIIDAGFQFKEEDTPGIDYILPNTKYLEERKSKIRGLVITHGHLDHIGAIPFIMEKLGNPPLYSRNLTTVMINKRQEEFPHLPPIDIRIVEKEQRIKIGNIYIRFFAVTHTIPDAMGIIIETPYGPIVHTGDLKLEHDNGVPIQREMDEFKVFAKEKVLLLMADSTNVERPGFSVPESAVYRNMEEIIKNTKGRLVIGTFSSQLERIIKMIEIAERYNKKIAIEGRSMKNNIEIVRHLGILTPKKETIIGIDEIENYPADRIIVLATGSQGEEFAALMRIATKNHKYFKMRKGDTLVLSSSVIPGNERAIQKLKDNIARQGARIIHSAISEVHSSGHANRDETMWIHKMIDPKFFIPIHGHHYMLRVHADIEMARGTPEANIVIPDNGMIIEIQNKGEKIVVLKERAPAGIVMVDGFSVGDIQEVVIRDRQMLATDGMFIIVVSVNPMNGKLRKSPDLISRGFVYLRESQELLHHTRLLIKQTVEDTTRDMNPINFDYVKNTLAEVVSRHLFQQTNKHPIVIPVVIGV
jgi:ribonuclease J